MLGLGGIHKERPKMFVPRPFYFTSGVRITCHSEFTES